VTHWGYHFLYKKRSEYRDGIYLYDITYHQIYEKRRIEEAYSGIHQ